MSDDKKVTDVVPAKVTLSGTISMDYEQRHPGSTELRWAQKTGGLLVLEMGVRVSGVKDGCPFSEVRYEPVKLGAYVPLFEPTIVLHERDYKP